MRFQLTTSLAAVGTILVARILDLPTPFSPIQILFVNIIADGPPAMSLGVDPPSPDVMKRKPLGRTEPILTGTRLRRILTTTALMAAGVVWLLAQYRHSDIPKLASTMAFTTFVFAQLVNSLVVRSDGRGVFHRYTFTNGALWLTIAAVSALQVVVVQVPFAQKVFDTVGLTRPMGAMPFRGARTATGRGSVDSGAEACLAERKPHLSACPCRGAVGQRLTMAGSTSEIEPSTTTSAISSMAVGSPLTMTTDAPLDAAIGTMSATGYT